MAKTKKPKLTSRAKKKKETIEPPALPSPIKTALDEILGMYWEDEAQSATQFLTEHGSLSGHIFVELVTLDNWLNGINETPESYLEGAEA